MKVLDFGLAKAIDATVHVERGRRRDEVADADRSRRRRRA